MSSIRVLGLTRRYGSVTAAFEVSFQVLSGGTLAILGPAGCGKTTILRCLAGLDTPEWGSIEIDGKPVFDRARNIDVPPEQRGMGIVIGSCTIWPHMTVSENVAFPLRVRGVPLAKQRERASEMLELVGLKGFEDRLSTLVSTGHRHRIALARALAHEPGLILFDEVCADLDPGEHQRLRGEIRMLQQRLGFTAIYLTVDQTDAFALAHEIILLNQGAIETRGPAREVFLRPGSAFAARFLGMNVLEGRILGPAADHRYLEVELSSRLVVRGVPAADLESREGGRVFASIRKEAVRLIRAQSPRDATGVIIDVSFMGTGEEYLVDIAGVRLQSAGPPIGLGLGDKVLVSMTPDDWVFLR